MPTSLSICQISLIFLSKSMTIEKLNWVWQTRLRTLRLEDAKNKRIHRLFFNPIMLMSFSLRHEYSLIDMLVRYFLFLVIYLNRCSMVVQCRSSNLGEEKTARGCVCSTIPKSHTHTRSFLPLLFSACNDGTLSSFVVIYLLFQTFSSRLSLSLSRSHLFSSTVKLVCCHAMIFFRNAIY